MSRIRLIVGLGNPENEYASTRHNAGFWLLNNLSETYRCNLASEGKFFAQFGRFSHLGQDIYLLKPQTYMNLSGKAVLAIAHFYKILPAQILVIHDELDFAPGVVKLKQGGGNGGHNGLKDIDRVIGKDYWRLRLGIGHPGDKHQVANYVLKKPLLSEKNLIDEALAVVLANFELILAGDFASAMKKLHTKI